MSDSKRYPRAVEIKDGNANLELMTASAEAEVLEFAKSLPLHDVTVQLPGRRPAPADAEAAGRSEMSRQ